MTETVVATRFRLSEILEQVGMTQTELARRSGVSQVTVNGLARNRTSRVDLATLDALSAVLGCEPGDLIEREPEHDARR